jgi:ketosteroid isomerase-like protein
MPEHPNVELVRRGYAAFLTGDMETVSSLFADGIVWHVGGDHQLSGDYVGKEAVFGNFGQLAELTKGSLSFDIHAIVADDDHAVVMVDSSFEASAPYHGREVHVFHIADGKVTEFWEFPNDRAALKAALGS